MPRKLCVILPEYQSQTPTHFNYLYGLLEDLPRGMDIFLIIEKGERPDFLKSANVYVQKCRFFPLRALENFLIIAYVRLRGYGDLYIHYSFLSAFNASLIARLTGGRAFYWNCGLPWLYRRNFFRDTFERLVYHLITFLVTGTESLKKEYAKEYHIPAHKIKVMPNWIDIRKVESEKAKVKSDELRKKMDIPPGAKILLFVHRLSRRKGAQHLPEIVSALKEENVVLVIAGDGPEKEKIRSTIEDAGMADKVRFIGWVPQNKVIDYFTVADIFLLPSEEEGFPHVLLESMAVGVPFAAFDVGGVGEIAPPELRDYLAPAGNLGIFVEKIKELLGADPKKTETLRRHELDWVRQFDMALAVERFKNLFSSN